ncbi:kinase-like domain-containing protein [Gorgonomyces haynaldii]|nr:kinase-like domain-containing protein [Gorgonomyces haynaldii]
MFDFPMDPPPSLQHTPSVESNVSTASTSSSGRKRVNADFEFGRVLGEGSYSTVIFAKESDTQKPFAVKMLDKRHILKENKAKYVNLEKQVLHLLNHPRIVKLYYTFQDTWSLYFVLEYCANGDFLDFLKRKGRLDKFGTQFYIQEILEGVEHMHQKGVIHRDLKPENILLDDQMHIKITDFGTVKIKDGTERKASFVGTAEYCSPELLNDKTASSASDIWAIGCILYQFLVGRPPFKGPNEYQTFQRILKLEYTIPDELDQASTDLITKILVLDPTKRPTLDEIKQQAFFADFQITDSPPKCEYLEPFGYVDDLTEQVESLDFE